MSYDPEQWLESVIREIKSYFTDHANMRIYDVVMDFPGTEIATMTVPITKTIVHFAVDEIVSREVGMGDNVFADNLDEGTNEILPQTAMENVINFDVGVWSADSSGGTTMRMRARQLLQNLFGVGAWESFRNRTDGGDGGIEIRRFSGGRFVMDRVNDVRLYRMVDCQMDVRVYSRTPITFATPGPTIEEVLQDPHLTIIG